MSVFISGLISVYYVHIYSQAPNNRSDDSVSTRLISRFYPGPDFLVSQIYLNNKSPIRLISQFFKKFL